MDSRQLYYREDGRWAALPGWAQFFLDLGELLAQNAQRGQLVAGIAVPSGAYAPALVATGIVAAQLREGALESEKQRHFDMLCSLGEGTQVAFTRGNKRLKGRISSVKTENGEKMLVVQVALGGNHSYLITREHALKVDLYNGQFTNLPNVQHGRVVIERSRFVDLVLSPAAGTQLDWHSHLGVMLVGQVKQLQAEICGTQFGARAPGDPAIFEGVLQDVLCVRRFCGSGPYKSGLHAARRQVEGNESPGFVVFAGARGYLEWRHKWPGAHRVVVLDKTSNQYQDAIHQFNADTYKYNPVGAGLAPLPTVPPGVELSILREEQAK